MLTQSIQSLLVVFKNKFANEKTQVFIQSETPHQFKNQPEFFHGTSYFVFITLRVAAYKITTSGM